MRWRIVYSAAYELRGAGTPVCEHSVCDFIAFHQLDREFQHAFDSTNTFDWHAWPTHTDSSLAFSGPGPLEYCLRELAHLYVRRQASQIGTQLQDGAIELPAAITSLQEIGAANANGALPQIVSATSLCKKPPPTPPEVIHGVLHQGGKMTFGGGCKSFKTWMLLELADLRLDRHALARIPNHPRRRPLSQFRAAGLRHRRRASTRSPSP